MSEPTFQTDLRMAQQIQEQVDRLNRMIAEAMGEGLKVNPEICESEIVQSSSGKAGLVYKYVAVEISRVLKP